MSPQSSLFVAGIVCTLVGTVPGWTAAMGAGASATATASSSAVLTETTASTDNESVDTEEATLTVPAQPAVSSPLYVAIPTSRPLPTMPEAGSVPTPASSPSQLIPAQQQVIPPAVRQAAREGMVSSPTSTNAAASPLLTLLAVGTFVLLIVDAGLLSMILFHQPQFRKTPIAQKRF